MKMRSSQKVNENKDRDDKIKLMQDRQRQWMEQRSRNSDQESDRPNNKPSSATLLTRRPMSGRAKPKSDSKKSNKDVLLWTSKNPEAIHDGFVVRKQSSARSDKSNKGLSSRNRDDDGRPGSGRRSGKSDKRTYANSTNSNEMDEKRKEHRTSTPDKLKDRQLPVTQLAKEISSINVSTSDRLYASSHDDISSSYDSKKYRNIANDDIMPASSVNTQPYISKEARLDQRKEEKTSSKMFSMHCCPSCRKLMYQQSHFPFLIIPCGHNICSRCCSEQSACPTCNAEMKSTVENVTLSHVISEHKKQEEKEELAKRENEARKYINEYDSLKTRCEVLSYEAEGIIVTMEQITNDLVVKKTRMKTVEEKRAEVRNQMSQLQEKLAKYEAEHREHSQGCDHLEAEYEKEKGNLDMLENTIDRVKQSKDRVKTLIHSYIPNYEFDDD